jgi:hypothetical protein
MLTTQFTKIRPSDSFRGVGSQMAKQKRVHFGQHSKVTFKPLYSSQKLACMLSLPNLKKASLTHDLRNFGAIGPREKFYDQKCKKFQTEAIFLKMAKMDISHFAMKLFNYCKITYFRVGFIFARVL